MDKSEAKIRFKKADRLFRLGRFEDALDELNAINSHFPNNHRVLNAQARTLERLRRHEEALAVCDRLITEFQYEKVRPLREHLAAVQSRDSFAPRSRPAPGHSSGGEPLEAAVMNDNSGRFRLKPIRLALLIGIFAGMATGYIPLWLGAGIVATYFAMKFVLGAILMRVFTAPFKMKGKALAGATCVVHGVEWTERPTYADPDGSDEAWDEEEPDAPLRYAWIDMTITPEPNEGGFTHWEPGELMLAPADMPFKGMDSLDRCYGVEDVRLVGPSGDEEDEAGKYEGTQRVKLLVGLPHDISEFRMTYYVEQFGRVALGNPTGPVA